jgi:hypothetical protein
MTASINIFNTPQVVTLTLGGPNTGATLMNYPVNRTDFKLIKGVTNEILFFVKDTDRHPVTVSNLANAGLQDIRIIITNPFNECLLLGSEVSAVTSYTTNYTSTMTTLSNSTMIVTNTTVIYSNGTSDPGGNSNTNAITVSNTPMIFANTGSGFYTVPPTVNGVVVELWGPGGAGSITSLSGAAGGAYAKKTIAVEPGETYPYFVGNSAGVEQATFWGNTTALNATFGAYGGASVANDVIDVSFAYGAPFGDYDVGYFGSPAITGDANGQASAWSGGNGSTNPAMFNESNPNGGGQSNGSVGTIPGGGAPAGNSVGDPAQLTFGGRGQMRLTQIIDTANANANSGGGDDGNSGSNSNTISNTIIDNTVTVTNTVSTSVTYVSNTTSGDASVLVPAPGIDPAKGVWLLRLKSTDIADWPLGYLRYSVICDRVGGDQVLLYTDRNYGPYGGLEVLHGPFPQPREVTTFTPADCIKLGDSLFSSPMPGAAAVGNIHGVMGAVAHLTSFTGSITVQASLENVAPVSDSEWFAAEVTSSTLGTVNYGTITFNTPTDGPIYIATKGNYMWMRFIVYTDKFATGASWSSIDYRNT